jgi:hypothetical protein
MYALTIFGNKKGVLQVARTIHLSGGDKGGKAIIIILFSS